MPTDTRIIVSFRSSPTAWDIVAVMARKAGMTRSEMLRKLLKIGIEHAPKDWRP